MFQARILFLATFILGLAASAAFRASGAVSEKDALFAAAAQGSSLLDPALPLATRYVGACIQVARSLNPGAPLFPVVHAAMGLLLATAAAVASMAAFLACGGGPAARVFAGVMTGTAILFGSATGVAGTSTSAIPMILLLLSATTLSWIGSSPRSFWGGLFLGLAVAEHPAVLSTLPGFFAMALGISLRVQPEKEGHLLRRAGLGFLAGLAAILLGGSEAIRRSGFQVASPLQWFGGIGDLVSTLVTSAGPLGFAAGLAGIAALFHGHARRVRPFLLIHSLPAALMVFGRGGDRQVLAALCGWSFLYFGVAAIEAALARFPHPRVLRVLPAYAVLSSALLLWMNQARLDRTGEKDIAWARDSFDRLTTNGLLLTANPVHWALAADGERSDLDVVYVDEPASLKMRRSPLGLFAPELPPSKRMTPEFLAELIAKNIANRPVFMDPTLFFRNEQRSAILGDRFTPQPFGLAFRISPRGERASPMQAQASGVLWSSYAIHPGTPPSPLRDGLTGNEYYARSLLQSAALYAEAGERSDAEREFLLALTLEDANPNLAALGLARVFFERQSFEEVVNTLSSRIREDHEGAWLARKVLGTAQLRLGNFEEARREIQTAMMRTPVELIGERESMQKILAAIEQQKTLPSLPVYERIPDPHR